MMSLFNDNLISNLLNQQETTVFSSMLSIERKMNVQWGDSFLWKNIPGLHDHAPEPLIYHLISMNKHSFIGIIPIEACLAADENFMAHCCEHASSNEMVLAIYPKIHSLLSGKPSLLFKGAENNLNPIQLALSEKNDELLERLLNDLTDAYNSDKLSDDLKDYPLTALFGQATIDDQNVDNLYDHAVNIDSSDSSLRALRKFGAHLFSTQHNTLTDCFNSVDAFKTALENNSQSSRGPQIVINKGYWNKLFWELIVFHAFNPLHSSKYRALSAALGNQQNARELLKVHAEPELLKSILISLTANKSSLAAIEESHRNKLSNRLIRKMEFIADIDETDAHNKAIMQAMVFLPIFVITVYGFYVGNKIREQYLAETDELYDNFHQCRTSCPSKHETLERRGETYFDFFNSTNMTETPSESPNHYMKQPCTDNDCGVGKCGEGADWYPVYKELHRHCRQNRALAESILWPTSILLIMNVISLGLSLMIPDNRFRAPFEALGFLSLKAAPRAVLSFSGRYTGAFPFEGKETLISALKLVLNCAKSLLGPRSEHSAAIDRLSTELNQPVNEVGYRTFDEALTLTGDFIAQYLYHIHTVPEAIAIKTETLTAMMNLLPEAQRVENEEDVELGNRSVSMMQLI
jgi:hypothetical protein